MAKSKHCKCAANVNKVLEEQGSNTRLELPFRMRLSTGAELEPIPQLKVVKMDPTKRERLATIVPAYCPFCGRKYPS
jgi:hypothetical protein